MRIDGGLGGEAGAGETASNAIDEREAISRLPDMVRSAPVGVWGLRLGVKGLWLWAWG